MGYFIGWLVLAILVGALGSSRKIGFGFALLWALLLSPVIGLIIVLISPSLKEEEYKEEVLKQNQKQTDALDKIKDTSIVDKLKDAKSLLDSGVLTQEEFAIVKSKIMASIESNNDNVEKEEDDKLPQNDIFQDDLSQNSTPSFVYVIVLILVLIVIAGSALAIMS